MQEELGGSGPTQGEHLSSPPCQPFSFIAQACPLPLSLGWTPLES